MIAFQPVALVMYILVRFLVRDVYIKFDINIDELSLYLMIP